MFAVAAAAKSLVDSLLDCPKKTYLLVPSTLALCYTYASLIIRSSLYYRNAALLIIISCSTSSALAIRPWNHGWPMISAIVSLNFSSSHRPSLTNALSSLERPVNLLQYAYGLSTIILYAKSYLLSAITNGELPVAKLNKMTWRANRSTELPW